MVKLGIPGLTLAFIVVLALFAGALALGLRLDGSEDRGFLELWRDEAMALLSLNVHTPPANQGAGLRQGLLLIQGLVALVLPALYIGSVVFRLFLHPDIFVFRRKITLEPSPETFRGEMEPDGYVLAFRAYNGSKMRAMDVRFSVVHQHWLGTGSNSVVRNIPLEVANPSWPMADCHVPYTFFVLLSPGDVREDAGGLRVEKIDGREAGARDRLVVHVSGAMPEVAETFVERRAFDLPDAITNEPWGRIHIEYGKDSRSWAGWSGFDA